MLVRSQRTFFADSGRFVAIPGRRGNPGGVGADLAQHVQRPPLRAGERDDGADGLRREAEPARRGSGVRRPPRLRPRPSTRRARRRRAAAAPRTRTAPASAASARARHDVAAPDPVGPLLGARAHDLDVREAHRRRRVRAGSRTCARPTRRGPRARRAATAASTRPGRPAPAPRSAICRRGTTAGTSRPGERVGDVHVDALRRVVHRGRRRRVREQVEQDRQRAPTAPAGSAVALEQRGQVAGADARVTRRAPAVGGARRRPRADRFT